MAYRDDEEPGPRWQHPLGGFSTERNYGHDDLHTPRDYNHSGDYSDYGRGGAYGGVGTSGSGAYGTRGAYGRYSTGGAFGTGASHSGFRGSWGRERGEFVGDGRHPREWFGGLDESQAGPHTGRGPRDYRRSDERIHEDACEILTRHGQVDASGIRVEVQDGEITLEGTVSSRLEKRLAEDALYAVSGARDVHNRLRVAGS